MISLANFSRRCLGRSLKAVHDDLFYDTTQDFIRHIHHVVNCQPIPVSGVNVKVSADTSLQVCTFSFRRRVNLKRSRSIQQEILNAIRHIYETN